MRPPGPPHSPVWAVPQWITAQISTSSTAVLGCAGTCLGRMQCDMEAQCPPARLGVVSCSRFADRSSSPAPAGTRDCMCLVSPQGGGSARALDTVIPCNEEAVRTSSASNRIEPSFRTQSWPGTPEHITAILLRAEAMSSLMDRNGLFMTSPSPESMDLVSAGHQG